MMLAGRFTAFAVWVLLAIQETYFKCRHVIARSGVKVLWKLGSGRKTQIHGLISAGIKAVTVQSVPNCSNEH
jgi:hypothetical protein